MWKYKKNNRSSFKKEGGCVTVYCPADKENRRCKKISKFLLLFIFYKWSLKIVISLTPRDASCIIEFFHFHIPPAKSMDFNKSGRHIDVNKILKFK